MSTPRTDVDERRRPPGMLHATAYRSRARRQRNGCDAPSNWCPGWFSSSTTTACSLRCPAGDSPVAEETGFADSVACAAVHYAGQPYYPENPQT
jgi:hypothetical protein